MVGVNTCIRGNLQRTVQQSFRCCSCDKLVCRATTLGTWSHKEVHSSIQFRGEKFIPHQDSPPTKWNVLWGIQRVCQVRRWCREFKNGQMGIPDVCTCLPQGSENRCECNTSGGNYIAVLRWFSLLCCELSRQWNQLLCLSNATCIF